MMRQLFFVWCFFLAPLSTLYGQCMEDCVWPGDMNANGIANHLDVLALGLAWGETGPIRPGASNNWEAQDAEDWAGSLPILGTNFKHCDADGNGELTINDAFVININYNRTNSNFTGLLGNELEGDDLFLVPQNTVTSPGGSLFFDVHLGTAANPINDLYGVGFQLAMDTQYVAGVNFDFSESWIGSGEEIFGYGKYTEEFDHAGTTITRLDGTTQSGFGKIAQIEIVIIDVILAMQIDSTICLPFSVRFENVLGIDETEEDLLIRSQGDTMTLKHPSQLTTSTANLTVDRSTIEVYPNPTNDRLFVKTKETNLQGIRLYNTFGQNVYQRTLPVPLPQYEFPVNHFPPGLYFLEMDLGRYKIVEKVLIQ